MKHIALVFTFAVALAAQQGQGGAGPEAELAAVIAVEEQERDLGKAETMYRELLAGGKLTAAARTLANERLGRMLGRLGRAEEAKEFLAAAKGAPVTLDDVTEALQVQDVEREQKLREKARELVQQILRQKGENWEPPLHGIADRDHAEQLLWIGEAAVPEVIAALQAAPAEIAEHGWNKQLAFKGLAGFLWRTGGTLSAAYLWSCSKVEDAHWRETIVSTAFQAEQPAMLAEAARFLDDPDRGVVETLLTSAGRTGEGGNALQFRLEPARIVEAALRGPQVGKLRMLRWAGSRSAFDEATLGRLHDLVAEGLRSTDPDLGTAASQFLLSTVSQGTLRGLRLLLAELPRMKGIDAPRSPPQPSPAVRLADGRSSRFTREQAMELLPAVDACARALGSGNETERHKRQWLEQRMFEVALPCDASVVPVVLAWMDLGYHAWWGLAGKVTAANGKDVFARFDRIAAGRERVQFLEQFGRLDLPADLFPMLRDAADRVRGGGDWTDHQPNPFQAFAAAMARTGDPAAADWILAQGLGNWTVEPLVRLGARTRDETVRAAMRKVADADFMQDSRGRMLLALLALHDEPALDLLVKWNDQYPRASQPYSKVEDAFVGTPLQYLLYQNPDPPHGFTEEQVTAVLHKVAANGIPQDWQPKSFSVDAITDRSLAEIVRLTWSTEWGNQIRRRLEQRRVRHEPLGPLGDWHHQMLIANDPRMVLLALRCLDVDIANEVRLLIDPLIESGDEDVARAAVSACENYFDAKGLDWAKRLFASRHFLVRARGMEIAASLPDRVGEGIVLAAAQEELLREDAAKMLGAMVSVAAVPRLIELLRDSEEVVRKNAADALQRIRFYHEQQAHWDRVLKGLDASAASAAEKLLLQARPGASKAQRLLAITSLGTLGAPEALPFLIDWTLDPDAELAAAAKAAITQIHLNPRK